MTNHLHGGLVFVAGVVSQAVSPGDVAPDNAARPRSLGAVVGNFKSVTARRINLVRKARGTPVWQRNYHERVIRNKREWNAIRQYIHGHPAHWAEDQEHPDRHL